MIRRLSATLPARNGLRLGHPEQRPVRVLAVSDEMEPALEYGTNRNALLPIDAIIGAGDLKPEYLDFLADAFRVPLLYVRGNHDRGGGWNEEITHVPEPMDGSWHDVAGLTVAGLSWPSDRGDRAVHDDNAAWRQVAARYLRLRSPRPDIIVSHVPPLGLGDTPEDHYHRGFAAYRWLAERLRPVLWIHGHTSPAAATNWWVGHGPTTLVNVTGAVLLELSSAGTGISDPGLPDATIESGLAERPTEVASEAS
ncbi:MAG: metallophosphoesterase family protein [Candidatus Limnocylindrales bacterium]